MVAILYCFVNNEVSLRRDVGTLVDSYCWLF